MALKTTEAVILKSFNWSESSRTVAFFTRDFGRLALVDKGGRRLNTKRGRLIPFARLEITFYNSEKESNGYISDVNLIHAFSLEEEGSLGRLAYGSAACELLFVLLSDEQAQPELYHYFVSFLSHLETVPKQSLPALFLTFFIHLLSYLGYQPSFSSCVECGKSGDGLVGESGEIMLVPGRGGVVCNTCLQPGDYYIPFSSESHTMMMALQVSPLTRAVDLPMGYKETTRLLEALVKFINYQTGMTLEMKSLEFLKKLKNSNSTT